MPQYNRKALDYVAIAKLSLTGTLGNAIISPNAHRGRSKRARGRINR